MVRRERVGAPVDRRCPFEKAILSATCECEQAGRYSEAEHLGVSCQSSLAWLNCRTLLELIREHSRFALKVTDTSAALPFGKDMKVMIGGLLGLQRAMAGDESRVSNIYALVVAAQEHFGGLGPRGVAFSRNREIGNRL